MPEPMKLSDLPPELWQRVSDLFDEVIDLPETERIPYIRNLWGSEPLVAKELMALLVAAANVDKTVPLTQAPFNAVLKDALAEPADGYAAGQKFGAWTLESCLGKGGMGEVWRAKRSDGLYKASVAVKLLRTDLSHDKLSRRFARERVVLARLNHPNIARLLDAGVEAGQAFIVLELVDGVPLLDYVTQHATTLQQRLRLVRDVALAVEHAHNQHVLHRDLKPSNVLVTRDGQVKLLDFGVAGVLDSDPNEPMTKLTQLTGRGLTLEYASPEQITGDPTMPASDVYSLGVLLFHLCTGNRPFAASSTRAALEYAVVHTDPPLASASLAPPNPQRPIPDTIPAPTDASRLRGDLDNIIRRAMRLAPEDRYPTASALAADLDAWMTARPTSLHAGDRAYATRLWFKRHWQLVGLSTLAVAGIVIALGLSLWQRGAAINDATSARGEIARARDDAARSTRVAQALGELVRRHRASAAASADPSLLPALEQASKDAEARLGNDAEAREQLRRHLGATK